MPIDTVEQEAYAPRLVASIMSISDSLRCGELAKTQNTESNRRPPVPQNAIDPRIHYKTNRILQPYSTGETDTASRSVKGPCFKDHDQVLIELVNKKHDKETWNDVNRRWVNITGRTRTTKATNTRWHKLRKALDRPRAMPSAPISSRQSFDYSGTSEGHSFEQEFPTLHNAPVHRSATHGGIETHNRAASQRSEHEALEIESTHPSAAGKTLRMEDLRAWQASLKENSPEQDSDSSPAAEITPFMRAESPPCEEDMCHWAYFVKRKVLRSAQQPDVAHWAIVSKYLSSI